MSCNYSFVLRILSLLGLWLAANTIAQAASPGTDAEPTVRAPAGDYRGVAEESLRIFRGIPYAAPPVGPLRWRPPQALPRANGLQDATRFGAICHQARKEGGFLTGREQSEDCLTLNIWTNAAPKALLPVMVYIPGGGFINGSGSFDSFDGTSLARQGTVIVTINYRLGVLGFFAHPALTREAAPDEPLASFGLMDQIAALRWVKQNIAAFGGDPNRVTIFGMSAGGQSVNYLMATPSARGLFHRAISESSALNMFQAYRLSEPSGGYPSAGRPQGGKPPYEEYGLRLARASSIEDGPDAARKLREIPVDWLMEYMRKNSAIGSFIYEPIVDGRLLKESVGVAFREGHEAPVPYIAGATDWEGSLAAPFGGKYIEQRLGTLGMSRADAKRLHGEVDDATLSQRLETDSFLGSQRWLVSRHARNGHPAWLYYFTYQLEAHRGEYPGAPHGAEMRYVFGTLDGLARVQDRPMGKIISPVDRVMAATVSAYWVAMARDGNPNGQTRPEWPVYSPKEDLALELGMEIRAKQVIAERMRFMEAQIEGGGI